MNNMINFSFALVAGLCAAGTAVALTASPTPDQITDITVSEGAPMTAAVIAGESSTVINGVSMAPVELGGTCYKRLCSGGKIRAELKAKLKCGVRVKCGCLPDREDTAACGKTPLGGAAHWYDCECR